MTPLLLAAALVAAAPARFGRPAFCPAEPSAYTLEKFDEIEFPTLEKERVSVSCLLYRDETSIYAEVVVHNGSHTAIKLPNEPVEIQAGGQRLARRPSVKTAEEIERASVRPFTPTPSGGALPRDSVQRQAADHVEVQEREALFAAFLITNALEDTRRSVDAGEHQAFAAAFNRRAREKEKSAEVRVVVHAGGDEFVFLLKPCSPR